MNIKGESLARVLLAAAATPVLVMRGAPPKVANQQLHVDSGTDHLIREVQALTTRATTNHPMWTSAAADLTAIHVALTQLTFITNVNRHNEVLELRRDEPVRIGGVAGEIVGSKVTLSCDASLACDIPAQLFVSAPGLPGGMVIGESAFALQGCEGGAGLFFTSGATLQNIVAAVNNVTDQTGVFAYLVDLNDPTSLMVFESVGAGSSFFVEIDSIGGEPFDLWASDSIGGYLEFFETGDGALTGDADCDGLVGPSDLAVVLGGWGICVLADDRCIGDLNLDGVVGPADLAIVLAHWGDDST